MKIARVFVQEYPGRQIGDIHDVFSPENHPGAILSGTLKEVEVADDFDKEIMSATIEENGDVTFAEDAAKVAAKALKTKEALVAAAYDEMNTEVFEQMETVFGTRRSDSATAYYETWKLMSAKPELFSSQGLKATMAAGGLNPGDALDTNQKVQAYADNLIENAEGYGVWRATRIQEFLEERAAILAG